MIASKVIVWLPGQRLPEIFYGEEVVVTETEVQLIIHHNRGVSTFDPNVSYQMYDREGREIRR